MTQDEIVALGRILKGVIPPPAPTNPLQVIDESQAALPGAAVNPFTDSRDTGTSRRRWARAASASRRSPPTSRSRSPTAVTRVAAVDADGVGVFPMPRYVGISAPPHRRYRPARVQRCANHLDGSFALCKDQAVILAGPDATRRSSSSSPTCTGAELEHRSLTRPRGTGDISVVDRRSLLPLSGYSWSPPRKTAAVSVARCAPRPWRRRSDLQVIGVVENMSWFTGDDGTRYELFGAGGGEELADGARRAAPRP